MELRMEVGYRWSRVILVLVMALLQFARSGRCVPLLICLVAGQFATLARATELRAATSEAFDVYVSLTEERMARDLRNGHFLLVDDLPEPSRQKAYAQLRQGQFYVRQLRTTDDARPIAIPGGLTHHWAGVAFIPGATLDQTLDVLQDFNHYQDIFRPYVRHSRLIEVQNEQYHIYEQVMRQTIITVAFNTEFQIRYRLMDPTRFVSQSYSTRIAQVEDMGRPGEHELPPGDDHGYLWRLDSYWRVQEKDGGVYLQVEGVALSRTVPAYLAWLVDPLLSSVPRGILSYILNTTRLAVTNRAGNQRPARTH
jgi:hypothetical protein